MILLRDQYHCKKQYSDSALHMFFFQLVLDVSTTMILEPGPVINFIMSSQYINDKDTRRIDWGKVSYGLNDTDVLPR